MFTNSLLAKITSYVILALLIISIILAIISTAQSYRRFLDKESAKRGLKKSLPYTVASFVLMSLYMLVTQPSNWINALCFIIVGPILVLLFYSIQNWQLKASDKYLEKHVQRKGDDKSNDNNPSG